METPGKYSLYPQRSQGGIWSYQAATCFVPLDRTGVPSSFRLTWTAAEIQQETERPGPRCAMWTWGVEEGRKKGGKWAGAGIYTQGEEGTGRVLIRGLKGKEPRTLEPFRSWLDLVYLIKRGPFCCACICIQVSRKGFCSIYPQRNSVAIKIILDHLHEPAVSQ
jgi:hypothetical protein